MRADDAAGRYLDMINSAAVFRPVPFDARCAVEVAEMTRNALDAGDKRHGSDATYAKIKYDRQIVATAKVEGAKIIYSDDRGVYNLGARNELTVLRIADLPLPPENPQTSLQLGTENEEAKAETTD